VAEPIDLTGKVVLITGGSRGLGRVMAAGLAGAGARVAITARPGSEAKLAEVHEAALPARGQIASFTGDITDPAACASIVRKTLERFGALHVLINNAAVGMVEVGPHVSRVVPFYKIPVHMWHRIIDTNINGSFHMALAAIAPLLEQKWGRIVNLSTGMRTMLKIGFSPYGPSKAAVEAMTAIWAQDLAGTGVTVNALLPGWVSDTDMVLSEDFPDRTRLVPPAKMVAPAVWLASDESGDVTGMRIIARDWDSTLPPRQAFQAASAKAGW
jgi:NAD(P)-dependent dehydrogenase (short-subunit alcohol dehydrogenase family)